MISTAYKTSKITELNLNELSEAAGGTFTPNTYGKKEYHMCGISTKYHFLDSDEFRFMGRKISQDQANEIVKIARDVSRYINGGYNGANQIGYNEPLFINAFNSQLSARYGVKWNGIPGVDL